MPKKELLTDITESTQHLKYFYVLSAVYIASIMTSLTVSARLLSFHFPMTHFTILLTGGTWTIPLSFFIQDITTEVYGYPKSRQLAQLAVVVLIFYIAYTKCITYLPVPGVSNIDASYNTVFNALPRHLVALLAAIFIGNLVNSYIISRLKDRLGGRYLPFRFITATAVGEAVLQLVGTSIAWLGHLHFETEILPFIAFSYLYKISFEAVLTPVNVFVCRRLKLAEGIDVCDKNINYNPFLFRSKRQ